MVKLLCFKETTFNVRVALQYFLAKGGIILTIKMMDFLMTLYIDSFVDYALS